MPAISKAQQIAMSIAEHNPEKLHSKNRGLLGMTRSQLHDYAATPRKGLPARARGFNGAAEKARTHGGM